MPRAPFRVSWQPATPFTVGIAALVAGILVVPSTGSPAIQSAARKPLEAAKSLSCAFRVLATATWVNGVPEAQTRPAQLSLRFKGIDVQDGTAEVDLGFGVTHVVARLAEGSLHFIHASRTAPVYLTTVFGFGSHEGKLMAVHSRHEYTPVSLPGFTSRPEQYYGGCEVVE